MLRSIKNKAETEADKEMQESMRKGKLVSDTVVNKLVMEKMREKKTNVILDGYPRNLSQAKYLLESRESLPYENIVVINIDLNEEVAKKKILGRVHCTVCKKDYNTADVCYDGYQMPAILPSKVTCPLKNDCIPTYSRRNDDNIDTITARFAQHHRESDSLMQLFQNLKLLYNFEVRRGIDDTDNLIKLMKELSQ